MAGADRSRVIGWGPFALPGEAAAVERARTEARKLLTDAGLIEPDEPGQAGRNAEEEVRAPVRRPGTRVRRTGLGEMTLVGDEVELPEEELVDYKTSDPADPNL